MTKRTEKAEVMPLYTRALIGNIDTDKREFDVTFATNSEVQMWDWEKGTFIEVLEMKPTNVRLERFNAGAPLLNNHNSWGGVQGVYGAVVRNSAKVDGKQGVCTIKFSKREDVEGTWQDIVDGILTSFSVGYRVHKAILTDTERKLYNATDWEPFELSLAPIPADIKAQIRSGENKPVTNTAEIEVEEAEVPENTDNQEITEAQERNAYWQKLYELKIK
ncbi:MAG: hypothetical protein EKK63_15915 [Acinetobacter sp.]|uniref:hypothetical protein n=1 Tax=Acinetobacter sp. TaxID=472 RepID=UPI000FB3F364|nr:hypothetical protein [Acinetobacter sp.]RUP37054.1 MAG: hypothetical protein EKK63_15915 [Acinetobacter sp.]